MAWTMAAALSVAMHPAMTTSTVMKRSFPPVLHPLEEHGPRFTALFGR
jgi:hypothetical protein